MTGPAAKPPPAPGRASDRLTERLRQARDTESPEAIVNACRNHGQSGMKWENTRYAGTLTLAAWVGADLNPNMHRSFAESLKGPGRGSTGRLANAILHAFDMNLHACREWTRIDLEQIARGVANERQTTQVHEALDAIRWILERDVQAPRHLEEIAAELKDASNHKAVCAKGRDDMGELAVQVLKRVAPQRAVNLAGTIADPVRRADQGLIAAGWIVNREDIEEIMHRIWEWIEAVAHDPVFTARRLSRIERRINPEMTLTQAYARLRGEDEPGELLECVWEWYTNGRRRFDPADPRPYIVRSEPRTRLLERAADMALGRVDEVYWSWQIAKDAPQDEDLVRVLRACMQTADKAGAAIWERIQTYEAIATRSQDTLREQAWIRTLASSLEHIDASGRDLSQFIWIRRCRMEDLEDIDRAWQAVCNGTCTQYPQGPSRIGTRAYLTTRASL